MPSRPGASCRRRGRPCGLRDERPAAVVAKQVRTLQAIEVAVEVEVECADGVVRPLRSGLTDAEFNEITRWVQRNTLERFGPVRKVPAELVFEIGFEGIHESPRHKSGIALRFPRMLRWRRDKGVAEIDTIQSLRALLNAAD